MEVRAKLRNARMGAQKTRLVADVVRGKGVSQALRLLTFMDQKPAFHIKKLIESGVANAEQTKKIDVDSLFVKHISVDMAPSLRRFRPRAQGRATPVMKKGCHINLILDER